ncbi:tastin isoform X1 [Oryctolagus cuniculus]|uniref:tastin isoform X1 n=1 Tax=Oryctolagus cuniculus TaxID=9986 RepID=UPI0001C6471A|nr:tastin isoform X1 [Oryctolagus cuniculus]XP_051701393.1 tastin isoform X1 [Oryctolagus cuniculus]
MSTLQAAKETFPRGVSPTPSKIPVRSQRRPPFPTVRSCAPDQENQDPRGLVQRPPLGIQGPLVDAAGSKLKGTQPTERSQGSEGVSPFWITLEELRPNSGRENVGPGPPPRTEAPGAIEFVADPVALATILSGEGVKSYCLGRQSSLAQRVLIRGNQGISTRRGQGARASAYLAPRTPIQQLDPARASCFSRLEGPGPRGRSEHPQRLEATIPPAGSSLHSSARPRFQELRRGTGGSSRTTVSQASGLLLETPVQPASSLPEGEQEVVSHSDEGGGGPLGLAQRIPLREIQEITHTKDGQHSHLVPSPAPVTLPMPGRVAPPPVARPSPFGRAQRVPSPGASAATTSYSMLRRFTMRPKTRFTPIPSAPRVQQARWLRGLSPQSCQEEPALSWGQIAVQLFDQETSGELQEGPGDPLAAPPAVHSSGVPRLQELKMQRISVLQQLLRQEVEGLAGDKCVPLHGAPSLDMTELQPVLAEISRTVDVLEPASGTSRFHSELPQPCLPQGAQETRPCPATEPATPESCRGEVPEPSPQDQPRTPEPCPPVEPCPQGQARAPEACPRVEQAPSEACSLPPSPQPSCSQGAPATTSLTFSSQRPLCASPPIHSLQSPRPLAGQAGPSRLAPRALALRQRLKACLSAIYCFHEARLDDECAFYTSRAPPTGPSRVCTNPVATLLEWQDALSFIPVGSAALQDSPP